MAIGETNRIGKNEFVVIGVAEDLGGMLGERHGRVRGNPAVDTSEMYHNPAIRSIS